MGRLMQRCTEGLLGLRRRLGLASESWVQTASLTWVGTCGVPFVLGKLNLLAYYLGDTTNQFVHDMAPEVRHSGGHGRQTCPDGAWHACRQAACLCARVLVFTAF